MLSSEGVVFLEPPFLWENSLKVERHPGALSVMEVAEHIEQGSCGQSPTFWAPYLPPLEPPYWLFLLALSVFELEPV